MPNTPDTVPGHQHVRHACTAQCAAEQTDNTLQWQSPQVAFAPTQLLIPPPPPNYSVVVEHVATVQ